MGTHEVHHIIEAYAASESSRVQAIDIDTHPHTQRQDIVRGVYVCVCVCEWEGWVGAARYTQLEITT